MTETEFEISKADKLRGGKVIETFTDFEGEFWGIQIDKNGRIFNVWINSDSEGNSPGSIFIEELK